MKQLLLYSRSGCHLCEVMEEELSAFIMADEIQVRRIFIDNDEELKQLYGQRIPVLMYNSKIICEYFFDPDALKQILID